MESMQMLQCLQHPNSIRFVMKWTKHIRSWIFDSISFQTRTTAVYSVHWIEFAIHFLQLVYHYDKTNKIHIMELKQTESGDSLANLFKQFLKTL